MRWRHIGQATIAQPRQCLAIDALAVHRHAVQARAGHRERMTRRAMVMRSVRVPLRLWVDAKAKADEREENLSDVIRAALERYVRSKR